MSRYRILLICALSRPWNDGWCYKAGFEKNGHAVLALDPSQVSEPVKRVFEVTSEFRPHLILHTKDELRAEVFQDLRDYTKVVQWYPDPVVPEWLPDYVEACDTFFTMAEGLVERLRMYNPNVFWLTQAFEPSLYEIKGITERDRRLYSSQVTFAGNLGSKPQYLPRRRILQRILEEGIELKWWGPPIPRKISTLPLILGRLGRAYGGKFIWGEDHAKMARLSKIYLGIDSQPHIRKSMSGRMYVAAGCGAFYMCQHVEGIEEVLEPDKEIVTFRDEDEMMDKIRFYLKNDTLREEIARAGQARVLKEHTYEIRIRQMISIIEQHL
jgi:hypothetical protein